MSGMILLAAQAHGMVVVHTHVSSSSIVGRTRVRMNAVVSEEDAKLAWLARLDVPSWGQGMVTPTKSGANEELASTQTITEDDAKKAWLARLDVPTWGKAAATVAEMAKASSEDEAKKAWLARLDVPTWGAAAKAMEAVATVSTEIAQAPANEDAGVSAEEIAKRAWLEKLDAPTWGQKSQEAVAEEAKKAWLARLDAPSWGKAAKAITGLLHEASALQDLEVKCDAGDDAACETLSKEEEAKKVWLAKLDVPAWGAAAAAVSAVATQLDA